MLVILYSVRTRVKIILSSCISESNTQHHIKLHLSFLSPAEIQVLVTVLPVNEFDPQFVAPLVLPVLEDARRGSVVGVVTAVDRDWPFNSIRLCIPGGDPLFSIDPTAGETGLGCLHYSSLLGTGFGNTLNLGIGFCSTTHVLTLC